MKKKILSLALALTMCLGLSVPVMAANLPAPSMVGHDKNRVSINVDDITTLDLGAKSFQVRNWEYDYRAGISTKKAAETFALDHVFVLPLGTQLTITNDDGHIDDGSVQCKAWTDADGDGIYDSRISRGGEIETEEGRLTTFGELMPANTNGPLVRGEFLYSDFWYMPTNGNASNVSNVKVKYYTLGYGDGTNAPVKISADYLTEEFGVNTLFQLSFYVDTDENHNNIYNSYYFLLPGEKTAVPETPTDPEPTTPPPAESATASPTNDSLTADGVLQSPTVYKINGSNYFKLRDLGKALDFYVGWSAETGVFIETGRPYAE